MVVTWTGRTGFLLQLAEHSPSREGRVGCLDLLQASSHIWQWQRSSRTAPSVCSVTTEFCILMTFHLLHAFNFEVHFLLTDNSISAVFGHRASQEHGRNFNVFCGESPRVLFLGFHLPGCRVVVTRARSIIIAILSFQSVFHSNWSITITFWIRRYVVVPQTAFDTSHFATDYQLPTS